MMALLWDDVAADFGAAKRHFTQAIAIHRGALAAATDYVSAMAFQHAMLAGYTSFEAGLKRLLGLLGEPLPGGPDSHAALVRRFARSVEGVRPALLDVPLLGHVEELRRFRHVALHAYDDFSPRKAAIPVESAQAFLDGIDLAIARFRAAIDPTP